MGQPLGHSLQGLEDCRGGQPSTAGEWDAEGYRPIMRGSRPGASERGRPRLGARWYPGKISIRITCYRCNGACVHVQWLRCVQLFETPWTVTARLLCPWGFPGKNTRVGCRFLLQGIFPPQGLNPRLLCCRQILHRWAARKPCQQQGHRVQVLPLRLSLRLCSVWPSCISLWSLWAYQKGWAPCKAIFCAHRT